MGALRTGVVIAAAVIAACASLQLGESTQDSVVITTDLANNDFGSIQIGSTSSAATATVAPAGTMSETDSISSVTSSSAEFVVSFPNGAPPQTVMQTCSGSGSGTGTASASFAGSGSGCSTTSWAFQVVFSPTGSPGMRNATIHVVVDGVDQPITVIGMAVAPQYLIDASPNPLPFGYVKVTTTSSASDVVVTNKGSQALAITSAMLDVGVFAFAPGNTGNTGSHMLAAGTSETYSLTCDPPTAMAYVGHLTITSNAANAPMLAVELDCTGTLSNLSTAPSPAKFMPMRVGDPATTLSIAVSNSGSTANLTAPTLSSDSTTDLTIASAQTGALDPAGPPKQVVLRYQPTKPVGVNGYLGTLVINYDSGSQYLATIFGEADRTVMAVSAGSIDFGPLCVGQVATQHVTAYASDTGAFEIANLSLPSAPFARSMPAGELLPYATQGDHGNEFAFDVTAMPSAAMAYTGSLTITTDIPGMSSFPISLAARGLAAGISPTPTALDFPPTAVDTTSSGQTVVLSNCGSGPINVQSATVTGLDAKDFAIALPSDPTATLQVKDSEMFVLVMSPHTAGVKTANLVITYDTGSTSVALDGNAGLGSGGGGGKDRETYYACSTGHPGSLAPIAIAVAWLARRRRRR